MTNATELKLAQRVAEAVAVAYSVEPYELFPAAHEHESLSEGAASVAWEGGDGQWALDWPETPAAKALAAELDVWFEPIFGCILAIYPNT